VNYKDLSKKFLALGCEEIPRRRGGSHRKWLNPATHKGTVVPDWGSKDLKTGTVRSVLRQLGISFEDLGKV
jgi:mRNA interferase HicA